LLLASRRTEETPINPKATVIAFAVYFVAVAGMFVTVAMFIGGSLGT